MTLITDLGAIQNLVKAHMDDYDVMRYRLQLDDDIDDSALDAIIDTLAKPIIASIDCKQCGNCCKVLDVYLEEGDMERLANGIHISIDDIMDNYIDYSVAHSEGEYAKFAHKPCAFLHGTQCSVYSHRPQTCRDYPFLTPDFRWVLDDLIDGAHICPIIYNTLEEVLARVDDITRGHDTK
jgi:Fe-S-cluster containining protein